MNDTTNVVSTNSTKIICHETDAPTRLSYNLTDGAIADVDLVTGELIVTTPIISSEDSVMRIPISHIMRQNKVGNYVTLASHLSVEEHLEKVESEDGTISYIYTDVKGDRYGFEEVFYTLDGNNRVVVDKATVVIDADGTMHDAQGEEVFCDYRSVTGLSLTAPKYNLEGIHLLEQRSDEQKQLEEQIGSYENALSEYVVVRKDPNSCSAAIDKDSSLLEEEHVFGDYSDENVMVMSRSEALQYIQLLKQKKQLITNDTATHVIDGVYEENLSILSINKSILEIEKKLAPIARYYLSTNTWNQIASAFYPDEGKEKAIIPMSYFVSSGSNQPFENTVKYKVYPDETTSDIPASDPSVESMRGYEIISLFTQRNLYIYQLQNMRDDLKLNLESIDAQITFIEERKTNTLEAVCRYYVELVNLKSQLKALKNQMPIYYLSGGDMVRGFNENGQLVMVMNQYDQYAIFEYDEDVPERLNCIVSNDGRIVEFGYTSGVLTTITDGLGARYEIAYKNSKLSAIIHQTKEVLQIAYTNAGGIDYIKGRDKVRCRISNYSATLAKISWVSTVGEFSSTEQGSNNSTRMRYVTIQHMDPAENGDYTVHVSEENSVFEDAYIFDFENHLKYHWSLKSGYVIGAETYLLETAEDGSVIKTIQHADHSCLNLSSDMFVFVAGDTEVTEYNAWHLPKQKSIGKHLHTEDGKSIHYVTVHYTYNEHQQLVETTNVDVWGWDSYSINPETGDKEPFWATSRVYVCPCIYEYNPQGKVVRTRSYIQGEEDTLGVTIEEMVYDEKGSMVETITYNSLNPTAKFRSRQDVSPKGQVLATYDESGECKTIVTYQADGVTVREQTLPNGSRFAFGFDDESRSLSISQSTSAGEENSTVKRYTNGMVTELHSGNNVVKYTYDNRRRLKSVTLNGETVVSYNYVGTTLTYEGKTCKQYSTYLPNGYKINVVKDLGGNRVHAIRQFYGSEQMYRNSIQFSYDDYGNVTERTYRVGSAIKEEEFFTYSTPDVLSAYVHKANGAEDESEAFTYDHTGALTQKVEKVGEDTTTYSYTYNSETFARELLTISVDGIDIQPQKDLLGRYVGKEVDFEGENVARDKITYRKVGDHATNQVSSMSFKDGTSFNYTYDEMGNITAVCENGELVVRYTYDDLCRLVREDNKRLNKTVVFVYDNNGNILVRREYPFTLVNQESLACTTEVPETFLYVYEGDRLVSLNGHFCTYDSMGCPTTYLGKSMTWDAYGKLLDFNNGEAIYTYDSHGRRISKSINGATPITFVYNKDGNLIYQSDGISFLYDHTGVMGMKRNNASYFYRKNAQGDVIALLDGDTGAVIASYIYDAWGNHEIRINAPLDRDEYTVYNEIAQANPFRYRSYYFDTETGFYYLPARYYDPAIGRFISQDDHSYLNPEVINGLNLYAYCLNNPVMNFDPSGHSATLIILSILAIAGLITTGIGVATDNNIVTAIGLTLVAIPALISGGLAISLLTPVGLGIGITTSVAGVGTALFASAEYQEAITHNNWMLDAGMSEEWYNGLMLVTATIATLGTIASSVAYSLNMNTITQVGKIKGVRAKEGYPGIRFTDKSGAIRSLEFHSAHQGHGAHLQLNNWWLNKQGYVGQYFRAFSKHFEIFKFWKGWF